MICILALCNKPYQYKTLTYSDRLLLKENQLFKIYYQLFRRSQKEHLQFRNIYVANTAPCHLSGTPVSLCAPENLRQSPRILLFPSLRLFPFPTELKIYIIQSGRSYPH